MCDTLPAEGWKVEVLNVPVGTKMCCSSPPPPLKAEDALVAARASLQAARVQLDNMQRIIPPNVQYDPLTGEITGLLDM